MVISSLQQRIFIMVWPGPNHNNSVLFAVQFYENIYNYLRLNSPNNTLKCYIIGYKIFLS